MLKTTLVHQFLASTPSHALLSHAEVRQLIEKQYGVHVGRTIVVQARYHTIEDVGVIKEEGLIYLPSRVACKKYHYSASGLRKIHHVRTLVRNRRVFYCDEDLKDHAAGNLSRDTDEYGH